VISRPTTLVLTIVTLGWSTICPAATEESNIPAQGTIDRLKTRTELLNELNLRAARIDLEHAKVAYDRCRSDYEYAQRLSSQNILSKKELDEALSAYTQAEQQLRQAEIALERTKLSFLANATHITILGAKKYYDNDGRRMLDLVLRNTSNLAQAESALIYSDPNEQTQSAWQSPEQIRALLNIENIIVSIVDANASIGKPYEKIIPVLPYEGEEKVAFELLTDVRQAGIKLQYLQQVVTENIYLEKESLQEIPTIVATQFSQEGTLGADIHYLLELEMLVTTERRFALTVTNLPPQINFSFVDQTSNARVTSVRFDENVSKHSLALRLSIPQKLDISMIDKTINLQAWAVPPQQLEALNALRAEHNLQDIPDEELGTIQAARVDLALIAKGSARLEILIDNLYTEILPQQSVTVKAELCNNGTLELFDLMPEVSPPLAWKTEITPNSIPRLAPNEEHTFQIHLEPGPEVGVGEYEVQIEARGQSGSNVAEAIEKRLKVRIIARTSLTTTLLLVGGLVALVVGIMIFGVRLSRR